MNEIHIWCSRHLTCASQHRLPLLLFFTFAPTPPTVGGPDWLWSFNKVRGERQRVESDPVTIRGKVTSTARMIWATHTNQWLLIFNSYGNHLGACLNSDPWTHLQNFWFSGSGWSPTSAYLTIPSSPTPQGPWCRWWSVVHTWRTTETIGETRKGTGIDLVTGENVYHDI